jgi:hypothetical protein
VIATKIALPETLAPKQGCGCLSIDAREVLNPDDEAAEAGSGAHYLQQDSQCAHSPAYTGPWSTASGLRAVAASVRR